MMNGSFIWLAHLNYSYDDNVSSLDGNIFIKKKSSSLQAAVSIDKLVLTCIKIVWYWSWTENFQLKNVSVIILKFCVFLMHLNRFQNLMIVHRGFFSQNVHRKEELRQKYNFEVMGALTFKVCVSWKLTVQVNGTLWWSCILLKNCMHSIIINKSQRLLA